MKYLIYILLILLIVILFFAELIFGSVDIPISDVLSIFNGSDVSESPQSWEMIIFKYRLPRAKAALISGGLLSVSGLFMQTLFRNPLAGPHILGVSSGSSLGVGIVIMAISAGLFGTFDEWHTYDHLLILFSFLGAFGVLLLLFLISLRVKDVLTVLIFGVLIGAVCMALVGILQYLSPESQLKEFLVWTLGSFDGVDPMEGQALFLLGIPLIALSMLFIKPLNLLLLGEEYAISMGLNVKRARLMIMMIAGAMTALITAYCGPIGFVGVVVPHFSRMIFKTYDHRFLIISSVLIGCSVMLFADLISHLPGSDNILPVNSITSLIGIPFIFWMLLKRKRLQQV